MLLQALHEEIEMKNSNLQVTLLVQRGVGTCSLTKKAEGTPFPRVATPLHPWVFDSVEIILYILTWNAYSLY